MNADQGKTTDTPRVLEIPAASLVLLTRTKDIYRLVWRDLRIHGKTAKNILTIGMPTAIQSTITAFSNVFVQGYVNVFGSACMAGWSCYNKMDQFIFLPIQSMSVAATTFVSQNIGAKQEERARKGTFDSVALAVGITACIATVLVIFAEPCSRIFTKDGVRGRGDSRGPMVIMLICFVGVRQVYLFLATHLIANTPFIVGLGYPVGWCTCCITELIYYKKKYLTDHSFS